MTPEDEEAKLDRRTPAPASAERRVTSSELMNGGREIVILHGEETYRLRVTRNGKLLLTK